MRTLKRLLFPALALACAMPAVSAVSMPSRPPAPRDEAAGWVQRTVKGGIAVEARIEPLGSGRELREDTDVAVRLRITDANTGQPLGGLQPAAWLDLDKAGPTPGCKESVEELVAGSLLRRPAVDLNAYFVLALNEDATVTVVDPLFGFGGTKLLAMVDLLSPGEDWALTADQKRLFVTQPEAGRVAVVDTASWKIESQVDAGPRPTRTALQPDGAYLWVGLDAPAAESGVAVVDARTLRPVARIATGAGPHEIALSDDNRFAFVTNRDADTLSVIDVQSLRKLADVATGSRPVSVAWSSLARAAFVAHEGDGRIVAVDGATRAVRARLTAAPGLTQIRVAPNGRLAFAVNPANDSLYVVDTAADRIVQSGTVLRQPDQVTFSADLAYVRYRGSETVQMFPLQKVGEEGKPLTAADFPGGQHPFGGGRRSSPAAGIVRAPGGPAVLVANPSDKAIYYYKEGMAAPMGQFQNYGREPRAVLVVDRSLHERTTAGTYETVARLSLPGRYTLALFLDSPKVVECFPVQVAVDPQREAQRQREKPARLEPLLDRATVTVGERVTLRFRLLDPRTSEPLEGVQDATVLIYQTVHNGQQRLQARAEGKGIYSVSFTPEQPGSYVARVESLSQHLPFHLSPQMVLQAAEGPSGR
jgi:YVTN family beta-propeller protein